MAIAAMKWAHRPVNLSTCEKGDVVCEDVTDCEPAPTVSSECCPGVLLPTHLHATLTAAGGAYGLTGVSVPIDYDGTGTLPGWYTGGVQPPAGPTLPVGSTFPLPIPGSAYFVGVRWRCNPFIGIRCGAFAPQVTVWQQEGDGSYTFVANMFGGAEPSCYEAPAPNPCSCSPVFCLSEFLGSQLVVTE